MPLNWNSRPQRATPLKRPFTEISQGLLLQQPERALCKGFVRMSAMSRALIFTTSIVGCRKQKRYHSPLSTHMMSLSCLQAASGPLGNKQKPTKLRVPLKRLAGVYCKNGVTFAWARELTEILRCPMHMTVHTSLCPSAQN